jgi:mono/diheme cytochrome c family protein
MLSRLSSSLFAAAALAAVTMLVFGAGGTSTVIGPGGGAEQATPARTTLVAELGCGGCHAGLAGRELIREAAPALGPERPLPASYVFSYLENPTRIRQDIGRARMPDFDLSARDRLVLAVFLAPESDASHTSDPALGRARESHPDVGPKEGEWLFRSLNCAGCHSHTEVRPGTVGPDLAREAVRVREGWLRDYLTNPRPIRPAGNPPGSGSQMPDFRLSQEEADSIVMFLRAASVAGPAFDFAPQLLSPFSMAKADAMLRDKLPCLGCHQLGSEGGRIGPRLDGVAHRLTAPFVRAVIADPAGHTPGTIMPRALLREDRQDLVVSYLLQREGERAGAERLSSAELGSYPSIVLREGRIPEGGSMAPEDESDGAALYGLYCGHCHGAAGRGDGYDARFLPVLPTVHADSAYMSTRPDDTLFDGIHAGGAILNRSHRMPAFGETLTRSEIRSLVAHIRELCRCSGPPWSRDGVRR